MTDNPDKYIFRETQRFTHVGIWLPVIGIAALALWVIIQWVVFNTPLEGDLVSDWVLWVILIVVGIGLPWLLHAVRLETAVAADYVWIRFWPLPSRMISRDEIKSCHAREYRPIREYGGWGIRCSRKNGRAYTVSGKKGVQLELMDGKSILIGSQRSGEFAETLQKALGHP